MILYTLNNLPENLQWASFLLEKKDIFLNEYLNYKKVVHSEYPVVSEHLNNMETCPLIKAFSVPFFTRNTPLRKKKEDVGYYNGICAPTYQMTPEERSYIRHEKRLQKMFDFFYFSDDDLLYLLKESYDLVTQHVPKLWQAMFIEFKPGTWFDPHVHPQFYLSSFNLNKADKYMEIQAEGHTVHLNEEEPLLVFDSSYNHIAIERGDENRILLVIGSEF
jgi:hypothetical protein